MLVGERKCFKIAVIIINHHYRYLYITFLWLQDEEMLSKARHLMYPQVCDEDASVTKAVVSFHFSSFLFLFDVCYQCWKIKLITTMMVMVTVS